MLRVVRSGAIMTRTAALNALFGLARSAVELVGSALRGMTARQLVAHLSAPAPAEDNVMDAAAATSTALRRLAARVIYLDEFPLWIGRWAL